MPAHDQKNGVQNRGEVDMNESQMKHCVWTLHNLQQTTTAVKMPLQYRHNALPYRAPYHS